MTMLRTHRRGFTAVELTVSLLLGGILLFGAWALAEALGRQQRVTRQATGISATTTTIDSEVSGDLRQAGSGLMSSWNWSGVRVDTGSVAGVERDTLWTFRSRGAGYRASTDDCSAGGTCLRVVGDLLGDVEEGDLLAVGSAATGVRIFEVTSLTTVLASCGGDCWAERAVCADSVTADLMAPAITESTTTYPDGSVDVRAKPCPQSAWSDGRSCVETLTMPVVGDAVTSVCSAVASAMETYTDVSYTDRTAMPFGITTMSTSSTRSGHGGVPDIRVHPLSFARYWVDDSRPWPTLVKEVGLAADGTLGQALPVARGVERFGVELWLTDSTSFERTSLEDAGALALNVGNPNFERTPAAVPGESVPGFRFLRSWRDIGAVRITYRVRGEAASQGSDEPSSMTGRFIVATPNILNGGLGRSH